MVHAAGRNEAAAQAVSSSVSASAPSFELAEATIADLQASMQSGARTAVSIAQGYLARIDAVDRQGPAINAVIELNPDSLAIAEALDRERRDKGPRGPLHGIPVVLKDNIDSADRMRTSAGSLALGESMAARDAFIVERLRAAGCVLLGKTNLSEWANFRSSRSTSGWSGRGGQTRNPYALDRNTSGSSSGSGAATAANLCAAAVGTETDGSIVSPASICGLVGIKPTVGLVSRAGIVPIAHSQDSAGPMTRSVTDAAILLGAMTGVDARDAATAGSRGNAKTDYTRFLDPAGLKGARIGVARDFFGTNDRLDRVVEEAIAAMKNAGAVVIDPVKIAHHDKLSDAEFGSLALRIQGGPQRLPGRARSRRLRAFTARADRVQRTQRGTRDAVFRAGAIGRCAKEGSAHRCGVSQGACAEPEVRARRRHRRYHRPASIARDRGAHRVAGVADRLHQR